nr:hypothetical protein [Clostridiales bacterium]
YPNPITFTDRENALQKRMKGEEIPDITDIPKALNDIVKKACSFNSKDCFQSASEMKKELIEVLNNDAPTSKIEKVKDSSDTHNTETEATESAIVNDSVDSTVSLFTSATEESKLNKSDYIDSKIIEDDADTESELEKTVSSADALEEYREDLEGETISSYDEDIIDKQEMPDNEIENSITKSLKIVSLVVLLACVLIPIIAYIINEIS